MKNILVPVDFSANSLKAAHYAATIALASDSEICLVHVLEPPIERLYPDMPPLDPEFDARLLATTEEYMNTFRSELLQLHAGLHIETKILQGLTLDTIRAFAKESNIDLLVMGTKGAGGAKELFIGSVAGSVSTRSGIPSIVVPDTAQVAIPSAVMLATSNFEKDGDLLAPLLSLARVFKATVHVVIFADAGKEFAVDYLEHTHELTAYTAYLRSAYPDVAFKSEMLEGRDFEDTLDQYATGNAIGLIAMVTYPKGFWDRLLGRSRTRRMTFHAETPILVLPARSGQE